MFGCGLYSEGEPIGRTVASATAALRDLCEASGTLEDEPDALFLLNTRWPLAAVFDLELMWFAVLDLGR